MDKKNQPLVVVTHHRDWPMLKLLAESITKYLHIEHPFWLITNDFNGSATAWYKDKLLQIMPEREVNVVDESEFVYIRANQEVAGKWARQQEGWVNQQVLKLAIAYVLPDDVREYLVLDSQNFLVNPWSVPETEQTPYRKSLWSMHDEIWKNLARSYDCYHLDFPEESLTTPIFLNKNLVRQMINERGGLIEWSDWFVNQSHLVSEFASYVFWTKRNNLFDRFHTYVEDYAIAYLRDSQEFDKEFQIFTDWFRNTDINGRGWASINHRAWQDMTKKQYSIMLKLLDKHGLYPDMTSLRK